MYKCIKFNMLIIPTVYVCVWVGETHSELSDIVQKILNIQFYKDQ
jgi:oligoribonuclease (3'-5' exoribonuclease)